MIKHIMRLVPLMAIILISSMSAFAQQGRPPDCVISFQFTAAARSAIFDNRSQACTTWHLTYYVEGFSADSIEIDDAPSVSGAPGTWVSWAGGLASGTLPLTSTTSSQITVYKYFPWVSVNLNSVTGSGTVQGLAIGFRPYTGADSNATPVGSTPNPLNVVGNVAVGATAAGNPVLVAGKDTSGNVQYLATSTSGALSTAAPATVADGVANGIIVYPSSPTANPAPLSIANWWFNGTTWDKMFYCNNSATFSVASTTTQVVALSGTTKIKVCSFDFNPSTATAGSVDLVYGTGANCATGITTLTGAYTLPAAALVDITPSTLGNYGALITPAAQALCVRTVTSTVNGFVTWAQY